jgi:hypothetical protein
VSRNPRCALLPVLLALGALGLCAQEQQPFFVYLFGRYSDFVNLDLTEGRIRDTISLVEKYRKDYPQAHASVTLLFSGALSQALAERNTKTGIKDLILDASRRGLVDVGYDGTDEPTYSSRPLPNIVNAKTPTHRERGPRPGVGGGPKGEVRWPQGYAGSLRQSDVHPGSDR